MRIFLAGTVLQFSAGLIAVFSLATMESAQPSPDLSQQLDSKIGKIHSDQKAAAKDALEKRRTDAFREASDAIGAASKAQAGENDITNSEKNIDAALTRLSGAEKDSILFTGFLNGEIEAGGDRKLALRSMRDALQAQAEAQEAMAEARKVEIQWLEIKVQEADVDVSAGAAPDIAKQTATKQKDLAAKEAQKKKELDKASAGASAKQAKAAKSLQTSLDLMQKANASEGKARTLALEFAGVSDNKKTQKAKEK